jgi:diaminopimelate epimerase
MDVAFEKYEGLGNDFVVVEAGSFDPKEVRAVCDRHFGVGADGVLWVGPGESSGARARMEISNADGSRPEMCGNGLRCVALHLAEQDGVEQAEYRIDTDAGPKECRVDRSGRSAVVWIDLGRAEVGRPLQCEVDGHEVTFERVSMGNPHAIAFDHVHDLAFIDRAGPMVSGRIEGGSNVEFVRGRADGEFDLIVWERGVGRTLACGTGAAATAAALAVAGRASFDQRMVIHLPGGPLGLVVAPTDLRVVMDGPARHVYSGSWPTGKGLEPESCAGESLRVRAP